MNTAYDIFDISDSSPVLWEAVCVYEDGDAAAAYDMVKDLCRAERAIFEDEVRDMDRKWAREYDTVEQASTIGQGWTPAGLVAEGRLLAVAGR